MFPVQTAITVNFCSILNKLVLMRKGAANARTKQATAPGRVVDRIGWSVSAIGCNPAHIRFGRQRRMCHSFSQDSGVMKFCKSANSLSINLWTIEGYFAERFYLSEGEPLRSLIGLRG